MRFGEVRVTEIGAPTGFNLFWCSLARCSVSPYTQRECLKACGVQWYGLSSYFKTHSFADRYHKKNGGGGGGNLTS